MRKLLVLSLLAAAPAFAQQTAPITLSPVEYDQIISELLRRDPVMSLLVQKQNAAQRAKQPTVQDEGAPK